MGNIARLLSIASIAAGSVGFIYLWAYWKRFGINFLEFATLADIIRLSLLPVVGATLFSALVQTVSLTLDVNIREAPPAQEKKPQSRRAFWIWAAIYSAALIIFGYALWATFYDDRPRELLSIGLGVSLVSVGLLADNHVKLFNLSVRQTCTVAFLALYLPIVAYGTGAVRAKAIAERTASPYRYADAPIWSGGKVLVNSGSRYLGALGSYAFFWTDRDTVLVARWEDVAPLELGRESAVQKPPSGETRTENGTDSPSSH